MHEKKTKTGGGGRGKGLAAWDTKRQKCASMVDPARNAWAGSDNFSANLPVFNLYVLICTFFHFHTWLVLSCSSESVARLL